MSGPTITKAPFGRAPDGAEVSLYTLRNSQGLAVKVTNYGGIVTAIEVPDAGGQAVNITLGFDSIEPYLEGTPYFGALVGRYANRIAHGKFTLDGVEYRLPLNNNHHHLHGGPHGFDKVVWESSPYERDGVAGLRLHYVSNDGEQGYPGNLDTVVTYELTEDGELRIDFCATTDRATPVNLTSHTYFNLAGGGPVLDHELELFASRFTPVDEGLIPTGELAPVDGTPFDFRQPHRIGERIGAADQQLQFGGGYDHNFVLDDGAGQGGSAAPGALERGTVSSARLDGLSGGDEAPEAPGTVASADLDGLDGGPHARPMRLAARVRDPQSGRVLELYTQEPGLQFYSGNFLDGSLGFAHRSGFCLEPQHFPDSPNQPGFPSTILRPGQTYRTATAYRFR
ncbi:aldose epimerase family protein [Pseudoduganella sp. GCM10020061]|uniref:aldose epimerase family protein n=1 Tax=Pseudoduganella sp. GCM10020061 TaxID=3317345 RepID=UPI00362CE040